MDYLQHSPADIQAMLDAIGVPSTEALFKSIPEAIRLRRPLQVQGFHDELALRRHIESLAAKNRHNDNTLSFLGGGAYDHYVPVVIDALISRGEYLTSYTPYQPETSQGNLQAMFEFQSMLCDLTGMEIANSSVYDGSHAFVESAMMALRSAKKRQTLLVSETVWPEYREVLATYIANLGVTVTVIPQKDGVTDLAAVQAALSDQVAGVMLQSPNVFGNIEDVQAFADAAHGAGAMLTVTTNPISLALLQPPGKLGADIVTGEGQPLGNDLQFGGPYFGFFCARLDHARQMPGRIVGQTVDANGKRGFVLTLQTREQHIRREKATSNICTNAALCALRGAMYMALMGGDGLREVALASFEKAHELAERIAALPGFAMSFPNQTFFNEFSVETDRPASEICGDLMKQNIMAGINLKRWFPTETHKLLIAVTERITEADMNRLVDALRREHKS